MAENKVIHRQKDRTRIDVNDPVDVEYVHHQFPWLSHKQIKEIIKTHGPDRQLVLSILERTGSGSENG